MCLLLFLAACDRSQAPVRLGGVTMGTSWSVTYIDAPPGISQDDVRSGIEQRLSRVNESMSTYLPESEISRFNDSPPGAIFTVSPAFFKVLQVAMEVGELSAGAYDATVAPMVSLWGFGPGGEATEVPSRQAVKAALEETGQDKIRLDSALQGVSKQSPVSLDFSSLAKGFAVDSVADWLLAQDINRFLVEVGGEMRLSGLSSRDDLWRIAIEQPENRDRSVAATISLTDRAVATSGDYRNFFEVDGQRYSHTIDPRTGYPVAHDLVSVTVVHDSAMWADAWATALTVLGAEQGRIVALRHGLAVYFIRRTGGGYEHGHTPAFSAYLAESNQAGQ